MKSSATVASQGPCPQSSYIIFKRKRQNFCKYFKGPVVGRGSDERCRFKSHPHVNIKDRRLNYIIFQKPFSKSWLRHCTGLPDAVRKQTKPLASWSSLCTGWKGGGLKELCWVTVKPRFSQFRNIVFLSSVVLNLSCMLETLEDFWIFKGLAAHQSSPNLWGHTRAPYFKSHYRLFHSALMIENQWLVAYKILAI